MKCAGIVDTIGHIKETYAQRKEYTCDNCGKSNHLLMCVAPDKIKTIHKTTDMEFFREKCESK